MKDLSFLIVTANENETKALREDPAFKCSTTRSKDPHDPIFYFVGTYGCYNIIHFELISQGGIGSDASALALAAAINEFHPDAVILVGIAFGKDFSDETKRSQQIGDVLISTKVADYESGKIKDGELQSDGPMPESGRQLQSVFKHYSKSWQYEIKAKNNKYQPKCEFGLILSGDKVVDDKTFKKKLLKRYPRAIGGEMEGRGAYGACRNRGIDEWIIVKSICDWADGTKSKNKKANQVIASQSAVALLHHIFTTPDSFDKVPKLNSNKEKLDVLDNEINESYDTIGYFVNFGITTCRLFEIVKKDKLLKERKAISYDISDPHHPEYLKGIIRHVKNEIFPYINTYINNGRNQIFIKAFADACFAGVFPDDKKRNEFVIDFYSETNLYFNILSDKQTEENLIRLFNKFDNDSAIINIGSQYIDILVKKDDKFNMYNLDLTLKDISDYNQRHAIPEKWNEETISNIKKYITDRVYTTLNVKVKSVVIIKDELGFMQSMGYPLKMEGGQHSISFEEYKKANREFLFQINYREYVDDSYEDIREANRMYGFKNGHIILETILEIMGAENIIPSNQLSIHGIV